MSSSAKGNGRALNSGSAVTTNANDLIFGAGATAGAISAAGAGLTVRSTLSGNWTMDRNVTATGSYSVTATASNNRWVMQMVAFKAAVGGGDTTPPSASMTAPTSGSTVAGTVTVSATATDDVAVADVDFLLDGVSMGVDPTAPYSVQWDTTTTSNGLHSLSARARDTSGNFGVTSGVVSVMVSNSAPPPPPSGLAAGWNFDESAGASAADVTSNGNTATLNGASWTAWQVRRWHQAERLGPVLVGGELRLDQHLGQRDDVLGLAQPGISTGGDRVVFGKFYNTGMTSPFYQYGLEMRGTANTPVFAIGTTSGLRESTMSTGLTAGQWTHLAVVFNGSQVQFYKNGVLTTTVPMATSITARSTPLYLGADASPGQFLNGALDDVRLYAQTLTAAQVQADMNTPLVGSVDPGAPTVSITSPANNAQVSGITTVQADASDDVGVAGVQFFLDGNSLGVEDTTAPYGANWDTRAFANGAHTLTARVRDTSGRTAVSAPVNVNVVNGDYFQNEILVTGLDLPTAMKFLPDGRMLVAELMGKIKVFPPPYTTADPTLFLQISTGVDGVQQGIFDLALDPGFATNHYYYVFYTRGRRTRHAVALHGQCRDHRDRGRQCPGAVPGPRQRERRASRRSHQLRQRRQDLVDHRRALRPGEVTGPHEPARQDPAVQPGRHHPHGQPLLRRRRPPLRRHLGAGPAQPLSRLLRQSDRAAVHRRRGRQRLLDRQGGDRPRGPRRQLRLAELRGRCTGPCTSPLYSYAHNGRDAAVTGGFVYRGSQFPAGMQGDYFFADYAQNWIKRLTFDANGNVTGVFNFEPADGQPDGPTGDIVYLTEGPDGALYYIDLGYSDTTGTFGVSKIRRIRYQRPTSRRSPSPLRQADGPDRCRSPLTFSSAGSNDPEGQPITYVWDFGDGTTSTVANPTHTYTAAGIHRSAHGVGRRQQHVRAAHHDLGRQPAPRRRSRPRRRQDLPSR